VLALGLYLWRVFWQFALRFTPVLPAREAGELRGEDVHADSRIYSIQFSRSPNFLVTFSTALPG